MKSEVAMKIHIVRSSELLYILCIVVCGASVLETSSIFGVQEPAICQAIWSHIADDCNLLTPHH